MGDDRATPADAQGSDPVDTLGRTATEPGRGPDGAGDDAWFALDQVNNWIRFADAKASVLLAVSGVLGGLLLSRPASTDGRLATVHTALWGAALVAVTLSALISVAVLLPRLKVRRAGPASLIYFGDIARQFRRRHAEFVAAFRRAASDPQVMREEVAEQIWANSVVARRKFRHVAVATWLIGAALVTGGLSVYLERM
jgi:hypothetical protein